MAKLMKRLGSPFWYARFSVSGKDTWVSTKKPNRNEAKAVAESEEKKRRGLRTVDESFRDLLGLIGNLSSKEQSQKRHELAGQLLAGQASVLKVNDAWQAWVASPAKGNPCQASISAYESQWKRFKKWANEKKIEFLHQVTPDRKSVV